MGIINKAIKKIINKIRSYKKDSVDEDKIKDTSLKKVSEVMYNEKILGDKYFVYYEFNNDDIQK
ncbi:hypothetical protein [Terrisporobacter sp.]